MCILPVSELQNVPRKVLTLFNFSQELQKYIFFSIAIVTYNIAIKKHPPPKIHTPPPNNFPTAYSLSSPKVE